MSKQKQKGTKFEKEVVDYLNMVLHTDTFHTLGLHGSQDEGDIYGLFAHGQRVVIECKNQARMELSLWLRETEAERGNADALAGVLIHKRKGAGKLHFCDTYVTMTLKDLVALVTGERPKQ